MCVFIIITPTFAEIIQNQSAPKKENISDLQKLFDKNMVLNVLLFSWASVKPTFSMVQWPPHPHPHPTSMKRPFGPPGVGFWIWTSDKNPASAFRCKTLSSKQLIPPERQQVLLLNLGRHDNIHLWYSHRWCHLDCGWSVCAAHSGHFSV